ncbi:LysR family transcriptional regulator [Delftia acidovorans]|uniref:LysR family transcriptional regulator n=1 Tax=Delftia acidovorans TaxID=80866 RepID=UPI00192A83D0|nr:LysR family transcriptional regulator [Delftia acidovorans]
MSTPVSAPSEMAFFCLLARSASLSATARELGITTPAASKRLSQMEARLGVQLVSRTTRRLGLTDEGQTYLAHARRILDDIAAMEQAVAGMPGQPQGLLRINATLGFGRSHIAPLIASFVRRHPQIQVQLQLSASPPPLVDDSFDLCIRFGEPPDARVIARRLAPNRRLLCASAAYLARCGTPATPRELMQHDCIDIRQGDDTHGVWRFTHNGPGRKTEAIRLRDSLSTNDGEIAVGWALAGLGIVMRAEWDIARYLRSGRLVQVLADHATAPADIHVVYPQRHAATQRVQRFVEHLARHFDTAAPGF